MILKRYVAVSLIVPFLIGFGVVTFLLTMDMLIDLLDLLISKGIGLWTVSKLFVLALGWIVALSIPCGVLVSVLMTYGRLSQDNEIIALRASGVHLLEVVQPALVLALIVAVALALFNNYILPETNYAYASLMQEISRKRPTAEIREGEWIEGFKGYDLWIGSLNDRTGAMKDVLIVDSRTRPQSPRTILARSGILQYHPEKNTLTLVLKDGEIHEADPDSPNGEYRRLRFTTQTMNITEAGDQFRGMVRHQRGQREMSVQSMEKEVRRLGRELAHQDSSVTSALSSVPVRSLRELDRIDPGSAPPSPARAAAALLGRLTGQRPPTPRDFRPEQKRAIDLVRARQHEALITQRQISSFRVEIHKKFSIPVACLVFVLVGAPLGMLARRGGLAAGFFSVVFFIFYYLCLVGGEQLADRLLLSPWLAMWLPNMILGALGIYLTTRAIVSGQPARPRLRKIA
jgi:lipopolysaccharide export system permease protein